MERLTRRVEPKSTPKTPRLGKLPATRAICSTVTPITRICRRRYRTSCLRLGVSADSPIFFCTQAVSNASQFLYVFGPAYYVLSCLMILVSLFLIVVMVLRWEHGQWWFIALEITVTAVIVVEVLANMIAYRRVNFFPAFLPPLG